MSDDPGGQSRATNEVQIAAVLDLGGSGEGPPDVATMVDPIAIPILWEWVQAGAPAGRGSADPEPQPPHTNVIGARPEN